MMGILLAAVFGAVSLDVDFAKGLVAIPSESRNIPECNRAVAYLRDYMERRGVYCHVAHQPDEHGSIASASDCLDFFVNWIGSRR